MTTLYELFADKGFHTSVATTFGIDFDAYENIVLSRLRGAGCRNNLVMTDSRMLTHALGGASALPAHAGIRYTVTGANAAGVFHPKLFLQFGRDSGRLIIGSANITPSGLAGNLELFGVLKCDKPPSGEQRLIAQAWGYVSRFLDAHSEATANQLAWMRKRTPWLDDVEPATGTVALADGSEVALLLSGEPVGIARRFPMLIDEPIERLIVVSPYWDGELAALSGLSTMLKPLEIVALIDKETGEFPGQAAVGVERLKLIDRSSFHDGRFIHAKALIAQSANADHVLFGSANCTAAAMGKESFAGSNAEACLYRRLPRDRVVVSLGLDKQLQGGKIVSPAELPSFEAADDLPLAELAQQSAGKFEARADTLYWTPPPSQSEPDRCAVMLLDVRAREMGDWPLRRRAGDGKRLRFDIPKFELRPLFAAVKLPGGETTPPAIITWIDDVKTEMREPRKAKIQVMLDDLEYESDARLDLLNLIADLEGSEEAEERLAAPMRVQRGKDEKPAAPETEHRTLSYDEFIAGRRPRIDGRQVSHNSLAGSDLSLVRGVLNRIIGMDEPGAPQEDEANDDGGVSHRGDETENAESALNSGEEFNARPAAKDRKTDDAAELARRRRAAQRRATRDQLVDATVKLRSELERLRSENRPLTNRHLLKLRALMMILLRASSPQTKLVLAATKTPSEVRVLPVEGDPDSWPVLLGRLLFALFGGNTPVVRQLHLIGEHDQIPDDFNECWATCYWCLHACLNAPLSKAEHQRMSRFVGLLLRNAFVFTLPSREELLSDNIGRIMARLSETYGKHLGIESAKIAESHRVRVNEYFSLPPSHA